MILDISWLVGVLNSSEVVLVELCTSCSEESLFRWKRYALSELFINGLRCWLRVWSPKQILCFNIGNISLVAWNVLCLNIACWPTNPVCSMLGSISILKSLRSLFLHWGSRVECSCSSKLIYICLDEVNIMIGWLVALTSQYPVDISCSAPIYFIFLWNMACVTRQIILSVINISHNVSVIAVYLLNQCVCILWNLSSSSLFLCFIVYL